jgi:hypothetical protein
LSVPDSKHLFWDACVIVRWLTESPPDFVDHISQYLREAREGARKIHISTISFTEVRPSHLRKKNFGSVIDLIEDFKSAFIPISPPPDVLTRAGHLKDLTFRKKGMKNNESRVVGTGDAIQLMTCIYAKDDLGIKDIVFHTFDEGKGKNWEGRCVPLIGFEDWCEGLADDPIVRQVIALPRCKPEHPKPVMI